MKKLKTLALAIATLLTSCESKAPDCNFDCRPGQTPPECEWLCDGDGR